MIAIGGVPYNKEKLKPFLGCLKDGSYIIIDGQIHKTRKKVNQRKEIELDSPIIAGHVASNGYRRIGGFNTSVYEHVLIYAWFNGLDSLDNFECIDHINGVKTDNRIENLEGVTIKENTIRAEAMGNYKRTYGKINGSFKFEKNVLDEVVKLHKQGLTQQTIGNRLGMAQSHVSNIINNKIRKYG